jgi:hypothetical protein
MHLLPQTRVFYEVHVYDTSAPCGLKLYVKTYDMFLLDIDCTRVSCVDKYVLPDPSAIPAAMAVRTKLYDRTNPVFISLDAEQNILAQDVDIALRLNAANYNRPVTAASLMAIQMAHIHS